MADQIESYDFLHGDWPNMSLNVIAINSPNTSNHVRGYGHSFGDLSQTALGQLSTSLDSIVSTADAGQHHSNQLPNAGPESRDNSGQVDRDDTGQDERDNLNLVKPDRANLVAADNTPLVKWCKAIKPSAKRKAACPICKLVLLSKTLQRHINAVHHHGQLYHQCRHCNKSFKRLDNQMRHESEQHDSSEDMLVECMRCGKQVRKRCLRDHFKSQRCTRASEDGGRGTGPSALRGDQGRVLATAQRPTESGVLDGLVLCAHLNAIVWILRLGLADPKGNGQVPLIHLSSAHERMVELWELRGCVIRVIQQSTSIASALGEQSSRVLQVFLLHEADCLLFGSHSPTAMAHNPYLEKMVVDTSWLPHSMKGLTKLRTSAWAALSQEWAIDVSPFPAESGGWYFSVFRWQSHRPYPDYERHLRLYPDGSLGPKPVREYKSRSYSDNRLHILSPSDEPPEFEQGHLQGLSVFNSDRHTWGIHWPNLFYPNDLATRGWRDRVHVDTIEALVAELEACRAGIDTLLAEYEALATENEASAVVNEALKAEITAMIAEYEALKPKATAMIAENEAFIAESTIFKRERNALTAERNALMAETNALGLLTLCTDVLSYT